MRAQGGLGCFVMPVHDMSDRIHRERQQQADEQGS